MTALFKYHTNTDYELVQTVYLCNVFVLSLVNYFSPQAWQPPPQLSAPSCHQSPPNSRAARLLSTNRKRVRQIYEACVTTAASAKEIPVRGFRDA